MHHDLSLVFTLTGGLAAALACGYLTQRLKLSPIVGYLLAGIALGPFTPGFTADRDIAVQFAEIGIILLMFGVGLSFHLRELLAVRWIAIPGALIQSATVILLGAGLGLMLGWGAGAGLVYGLAISVASTVVLIRVLSDNNDLHTVSGHIAVGWLVVEDLFTVIALVVLPLFGSQQHGAGWLPSLGLLAVKLAAIVILAAYLGEKVIPLLLNRVAATKSRELFTLTVLVVALGIAVGAALIFGVSMALGAFLAGMIVGRSEFSLRAAHEAIPMRDAFAVLFFVSVGMMFDWRCVLAAPALVAATTAIVIVAKPLIAFLLVILLGYPLRTALAVAVALGQVGEFTFMLGSLAGELGLLPTSANAALIFAAIFSITLNPILYSLITPGEKLLRRLAARAPWCTRFARTLPAEPGEHTDTAHSAILVGYGPVGQIIYQLLVKNGIHPVVVELNINTVRQLKEDGIDAVYGDIGHPETLQAARARQARVLIFSASNTDSAGEAIRIAKQLNPAIHVLVRSAYINNQSAAALLQADTVLHTEVEMALAMAVAIMEFLGATPEQVDRERVRVRRELGEAYPA